MSTHCPRCLKPVNTGGIHTCTPTAFARDLEEQNALLMTFICEHGGLLTQWAAEWVQGKVPRGITLREYILDSLKKWLSRKELLCSKT